MSSKQQTIDPQAIKKQPFTLVAWLHLVMIAAILSSPFLFSWPIILTGIVLYELQILWLGDCILTRRQFVTKTRSVTFYYYLFTKFGFTPNGYHVRFIADYILPPIIIGIAIIWQVLHGAQPLIV